MQLLLNPTSPFARVARMAALEAGLADRLTLVWCDPWSDDPALLAVHPGGRVPVLVTDEGVALAESLLIAQYLDQRAGGGRLLPPDQLAATLHRVSVGYGLMEAAFQTVIARKHDGHAADASVMGQRRAAALTRGLAVLADEAAWLPEAQAGWALDAIVVAVALAYLRFRLPEVAVPAVLQAWLDRVAHHPSLRGTDFAAGEVITRAT